MYSILNGAKYFVEYGSQKYLYFNYFLNILKRLEQLLIQRLWRGNL